MGLSLSIKKAVGFSMHITYPFVTYDDKLRITLSDDCK